MSSTTNNKSNRDSDGLRASVLDAALELGIGNLTVAKWMFDPVDEEEEEEEEEPHALVAPSLTTTPTITSEESYHLAPSPPSFPYQNQSKPVDPLNGFGYLKQRGISVDSTDFGTSSHSSHSWQTPSFTTPTSRRTNKLRKARPDGYESDGRYVNDRVSSKKEKHRQDEVDTMAGYKSDGEAVIGKKKRKDKLPSLDGAESDGEHLSEAVQKKKKSFFRRNKAKTQPGQEREIVPPLPRSLPVFYPTSNQFDSRSTSLSMSIDSGRGSSLAEVSDSSGNVTPTATYTPGGEPAPLLTHAFKEDAQSIAGSVDWSHAYSHFPRIIRSPRPPMPAPFSEVPLSRPNTAPAMVTGHPHQLRTRPSPLLLSPIPANYSNASEVSPVPSEVGSITPDPKSTGTVYRNLLQAAAATPDIGWKSPNVSPLTPSPNDITPSSDYVAASANNLHANPLRPRALANYDLPPPSPPPSGPLPRVPPLPEPGSWRMRPSRLGISSSPSVSSPAPSPRPRLPIQRGKEVPFLVNPVIRVDEQRASFPADVSEKRCQLPHGPQTPLFNSSGIRKMPAPNITPRRPARPRDMYIGAAPDDRHPELGHTQDVNSVLSAFRDRNSTVEDAYMNMESDPEYEDEDSVIDRSSVWTRTSIADQREGSRLVQNVEDMYNSKGRERRIVSAPGAPPIPPRSILRNGMSRI